jgi:hypothetical protein
MKDLNKYIKAKIREYLNENTQSVEELIQRIKKSLIMETLVDEEEFNEWINSFFRVNRVNFCNGSEYIVKYGIKNYLIGIRIESDPIKFYKMYED